MGWYGLQNAILARDADELVEELSPRRNPNDPGSALHIAVKQMTAPQREQALAWADAWLRETGNDCLRARGDARWRAVNLVEQICKAHAVYPAVGADLDPWMAIANYGSWHPGVPSGKVLIFATRGGTHAQDAPRRKYLVPAEEYANGPRPFVIDPMKHEEVQ